MHLWNSTWSAQMLSLASFSSHRRLTLKVYPSGRAHGRLSLLPNRLKKNRVPSEINTSATVLRNGPSLQEQKPTQIQLGKEEKWRLLSGYMDFVDFHNNKGRKTGLLWTPKNSRFNLSLPRIYFLSKTWGFSLLSLSINLLHSFLFSLCLPPLYNYLAYCVKTTALLLTLHDSSV